MYNTCAYAYVRTCVYARACVHAHTRASAHTQARPHTHTHIHTHTRTHTHTHAHTHTHTHTVQHFGGRDPISHVGAAMASSTAVSNIWHVLRVASFVCLFACSLFVCEICYFWSRFGANFCQAVETPVSETITCLPDRLRTWAVFAFFFFGFGDLQ